MGYPVYKLIRAVNRQYPNNGFINYVDVREDSANDYIIDEDLRDLINEAIQETYINIARDEVFSFPTVPGQNQYALPEDCDLRDIQEVTRTFIGCRGPMMPPPMEEDEEEDEEEMNRLTEDIELAPGVGLSMKSGFYFTGPYKVTNQPTISPIGKETMFGNNTVFYYDADTLTLTGGYISITRDVNEKWQVKRDEFTNADIEEAPKVSAITARLDEETTLGDSGEAVLPLGIISKAGDKLGLAEDDNTKIVVGKDIDYVLITASVVWDKDVASPSTRRSVELRINGAVEVLINGSEEYNQSIPGYLRHVTEGSTIELAVYGAEGDVIKMLDGSGDTEECTYITVTQIKGDYIIPGNNGGSGNHMGGGYIPANIGG